MRDTLLAQITTNLSGTSVKVSSELPWNNGGEVLYIRNKKHFYLDQEQEVQEEFIKCLDKNDVGQTTTTLNGYLTVDAKNQPSDISNVVTSVLSANSVITASVDTSAEVTTEIEDDYITYTFEFNFITIN